MSGIQNKQATRNKGCTASSKLASDQMFCDVLRGAHRDCRVECVWRRWIRGCCFRKPYNSVRNPYISKARFGVHCLVTTGTGGGAMAKVRHYCNRRACVYYFIFLSLQSKCDISKISVVECLDYPDGLAFLAASPL